MFSGTNKVGSGLVAAVDTGEFALRFSACLVYHCALRARPAGVAGINSGNRDCLPHRLVLRKLAKLIEGPSRKTAALRLFNLRPLADVRQVFQRNRRTGAFGGSNSLLGNNVVGVLAKAGLLAAELLQATLGGCGAASLKHSSLQSKTRANLLKSRASSPTEQELWLEHPRGGFR
jgi:hypothetical protein